MHMLYTLPTLAIFLVCLLTRNIALHVGGLGFLTASILQRYASCQKASTVQVAMHSKLEILTQQYGL